MKILFISDIHGIDINMKKIETVIEFEQIDKLVVLGDLYYAGPTYNKKQELENNLKKYMENIQYFIDEKVLEGNIIKSLEELNSVIKKFLDYDVSTDYEKIISFVSGSASAIKEIDKQSFLPFSRFGG
jgi:calcineurin-like phosphoesterase